MKRRYCLGGLITILSFYGTSCVHQVSAHPSTSPSARAAARLKYRPPANWIRHYLGDDRYKIAGNVWKVVSTQNDTYFHRPTCPNMLRQPAGIVIGFSTPADAFESGYAPCPTCQPGAELFSYSGTSVQTSSNSELSNYISSMLGIAYAHDNAQRQLVKLAADTARAVAAKDSSAYAGVRARYVRLRAVVKRTINGIDRVEAPANFRRLNFLMRKSLTEIDEILRLANDAFSGKISESRARSLIGKLLQTHNVTLTQLDTESAKQLLNKKSRNR